VTDGYAGCPGIGPVKAEQLLNVRETMPAGTDPHPQLRRWAAVVEAFKKAKLTEADALLQARLARILRCTEWDFDNSTVKLWEPPR
jgi:DNA polymerase-1